MSWFSFAHDQHLKMHEKYVAVEKVLPGQMTTGHWPGNSMTLTLILTLTLTNQFSHPVIWPWKPFIIWKSMTLLCTMICKKKSTSTSSIVSAHSCKGGNVNVPLMLDMMANTSWILIMSTNLITKNKIMIIIVGLIDLGAEY